MLRFKQLVLVALLVGMVAVLNGAFVRANADRFSSSNYTIDASVGNSFGGSNSSTNYKLVSSGGESVIGNASGGSYKLGAGYVAQLQQSLQMTVQPANLLAYYPLDESTGTLASDGSASAFNGTVSGGATWGTGKLNNALSFDGVDDTVTVPHNSSLNITGDMTISAWVKPTSLGPFTSGSANVVSKRTTTAHAPFHLRMKDNGQMRFEGFSVSSAGYVGVNAATNIDTSRYYHITGVRSSSQVKIYIDGVLSNSTAWSGVADTNTEAMLIGGATSQFSAFPGNIDEVKIYNRALTDAEVKADYQAQNAGNNSGVSLNTITPGASQTAALDAIILTDAPDYTLSVNQNQNLTSGSNTIPAVSGSIASPITWSEGSTKGLGFTLYGTTATALPGKWSSGGAYAAFPNSSTSFYDRSGFTSGAKDVLNIRLRADAATSQATGDYTNTITWTGTMTP